MAKLYDIENEKREIENAHGVVPKSGPGDVVKRSERTIGKIVAAVITDSDKKFLWRSF
jgi:hypothetical protein